MELGLQSLVVYLLHFNSILQPNNHLMNKGCQTNIGLKDCLLSAEHSKLLSNYYLKWQSRSKQKTQHLPFSLNKVSFSNTGKKMQQIFHKQIQPSHWECGFWELVQIKTNICSILIIWLHLVPVSTWVLISEQFGMKIGTNHEDRG